MKHQFTGTYIEKALRHAVLVSKQLLLNIIETLQGSIIVLDYFVKKGTMYLFKLKYKTIEK